MKLAVIRHLAIVPIVLALSSGAAWPQTEATDEHATARYNEGDIAGAVEEFQRVLAKAPDDPRALYLGAAGNLELGRLAQARALADRLVKISGGFVISWELMAQIAQGQGDLKRRDEAIDEVKMAIRTAVNPAVRAKGSFIRDRIAAKGGALAATEFFLAAGTDFTRYQINWVTPEKNGETALLLRTDSATTQTWAETALMPPEKLLFHLDMVTPKEGGEPDVATYAYFVGEPAYDAVRAKVLEILQGKLKPQSGKSGALEGILRP